MEAWIEQRRHNNAHAHEMLKGSNGVWRMRFFEQNLDGKRPCCDGLSLFVKAVS
jgi:hypothetical protein